MLVLLADGCGGGSGGARAVLSNATSHIGEIRAGELSVRFTLTPTAAPADTVGVLIRGSFALDRRHRLPSLHITYTRLAGPKSPTTAIDSDGRFATIGSNGQRTPLTAQQEQQFAATLQGPQGLGNLPLHLDRWVSGPRQSSGPRLGGQGTDQITGTVDLPQTVNDLNQLTGGQVNQARRANGTGTSGAIEKTLRSSAFFALVGHTDHLLRRLDLQAVLVPLGGSSAGPRTPGLTIALHIAITPHQLPR
jgi:hypothetical protein